MQFDMSSDSANGTSTLSPAMTATNQLLSVVTRLDTDQQLQMRLPSNNFLTSSSPSLSSTTSPGPATTTNHLHILIDDNNNHHHNSIESNALPPMLLSSTGLGPGLGLGSASALGLGSGLGSGMVIGHGVIGRSSSVSPHPLSPGLSSSFALSPNARDYLDAEAGTTHTPSQYTFSKYPLNAPAPAQYTLLIHCQHPLSTGSDEHFSSFGVPLYRVPIQTQVSPNTAPPPGFDRLLPNSVPPGPSAADYICLFLALPTSFQTILHPITSYHILIQFHTHISHNTLIHLKTPVMMMGYLTRYMRHCIIQ